MKPTHHSDKPPVAVALHYKGSSPGCGCHQRRLSVVPVEQWLGAPAQDDLSPLFPQQWYSSSMKAVCVWLTDRLDLQLHVYQLKTLIKIVKVGC